jgi:GH24 family phage-related lysozyme (muramidase)
MQGQSQLISREGVIKTYYNDSAGICTYGVGTVAHEDQAPCKADELRTQVSDDDIAKSFQEGISKAENAVKK